jgi:hypothetical protein
LPAEGAGQALAAGQGAGQHDICASRLVERLVGIVMALHQMPGDLLRVDLGRQGLPEFLKDLSGKLGVSKDRNLWRKINHRCSPSKGVVSKGPEKRSASSPRIG